MAEELDKSEPGSPYKLQKARERGQVAKSADVVGVIVFTTAMVFLTWRGFDAWCDAFRLDQALLVHAATADSPTALWALVVRMIRAALLLAAPFFLTIIVAGIAGNVLQTRGPVISFDPLKPDWARLNPAQGLKKLFTVRTLFVAFRALLKLALLGTVAYFALKSLVPHFYVISGLSPIATLRTLLADMGSLGLKMALLLALIAVVDLVYTRREFAKQMRMSKRELKDEVKHREGDPRIRGRLRELRREMLKRSLAVRRTRDADVVITNPTHFAVALRYVHGQMASPRLVAKGAGALAATMREIAARHRIPVVRSPSLARQLFHDLPVDGAVPPTLYAPVARILVWVFAMREAAGRRGAAAAGGAA